MTEKSPNLANIASEIYELVKDLESEERRRVIAATLAFFGEGAPKAPVSAGSAGGSGVQDPGELNLGKKAALWMRQNSLTADMLQEIFHFDETGTVEVIAADVPGANKKAKTGNVYLLCGVKNLLQGDEAKVDNQVAVELCQHMGCYDKNNHTANRKALGNKLTGSVKDGFVLPSPGLKAGAELIKAFT